jgi:hypothetical protein
MNKLMLAHRVLVVVTVVCGFMLSGCTFNTQGLPVLDLTKAPIVLPHNSGGDIVLSYPIFIYHGYQEAMREAVPAEEGEKVVMKVPGSFVLPKQYSKAIVYLNGWKLGFNDKQEQQVAGIGVVMGPKDLTFQGNLSKLDWDVYAGIVGEDLPGYDFRYWYTVIAWDDSIIKDAFIKEESPSGILNEFAHFNDNKASILPVPRYLYDAAFENRGSVSLLPRGFAFAWGDETFSEPEWNYLLQLGYHLGPSERYIYENGGYKPKPNIYRGATSRRGADFVDMGYASWESTALFKHNDDPDEFLFADFVAAVQAKQFSVLEPHFALRPHTEQGEPGTGIIGGPGAMETEERVVVKNVPFHFAVPVLKGWDLHFDYDNEQVKTIGVWIDNFSYEREGGRNGTLTYTWHAVLDDEEQEGSSHQAYVSILGINDIYPD